MSETHSSLEDVIKSKPDDWEERRLGDLFKQRKEKNRPDLCSGQLIPDSDLGFSSATAGAIPPL